ncbi:hypothetical protein F2P56_021614 [Juglans regia]|uniref:Reverse transcriptase Ty1/copia-type domain-containing protein n=1 Tax=Juglans regia TaxID=51240 RepID=A0A833TDS1_JUGRE|nr:hypothetical protein F2P56_021614 [Juglans regia]
MSCQNFLEEVKALTDELSTVGKPIEDSDLILSVLNGLNSSFHSFVTTYMLLAKEKSMPFFDFHAELLNYDLMQKFHNQSVQPKIGSYALYSNKPGAETGSRNNNRSRFTVSSKSNGHVTSQFRQPLPHLPTSTPASSPLESRSCSPCQICKRENHQALDYFNHMNYAFQGHHHPTELAAMVAEANTTYLNQHQWYADSSANVHITSNVANLATSNHMKARTPWDISTGVTLLTGPSGNGLYPINLRQLSSSKLHALTMTIGVKALTSTWHCRLGHPFAAILHRVLTSFSLPYLITNSDSSVTSSGITPTLLLSPPHILSSLSSDHSLVPDPPLFSFPAVHMPIVSLEPISSPPSTPISIDSIEPFVTSSPTIAPSLSNTFEPHLSPPPYHVVTRSQTGHLQPCSPSSTPISIDSPKPLVISSPTTTSSLSNPSEPQLPSYHVVTRSQTGHLQPCSFPGFKLYHSTRHPLHALHADAIISEPRTYAQAASMPEWCAAMESEFQALLRNATWTLCSLPPGKNVVPNIWVFKCKRRPDGSIERLKTQLVVVGYLQRSGLDFHEIFSPVIKPSTVQEGVYMAQPKGFEDPEHPDFVCKLHKSL